MSPNSDQTKLYKVGEPELPNLEDYQRCISQIWTNKTLSNFGPYATQFENMLKDYFGISNIVLFANGTSSLEALICVMDLKKEILTTAFSFVGTLTPIIRNQILPTFVDVGIDDGNIQTKDLQKKLCSKMGAILAVHSYGFSADVDNLEIIGKTADLPIIYDAAHSMGSLYKNEHLVSYGDASIVSFHATKILNSIEGGAVITKDANLAKELARFRNFGYNINKSFSDAIGTNSKMSELHAAAGFLQLQNFHSTLKKRQDIFSLYESKLGTIEVIKLFHPREGSVVNGSYFPILLDNSGQRESLMMVLEKNRIFTKPYFNTSLSKFYQAKPVNEDLQVTDELTQRVLCLPIHSSMSEKDVSFVSEQIESFFMELQNDGH